MKRINLLSDTIARIILTNGLCRVDRTEWLSEVLSPFMHEENLEELATMRPEDFLTPSQIDRIACEEFEDHIKHSSILSSGFSLLGRSSIALSTLGDTIAFWTDLIVLTQKLAYLYGWDDFYEDGRATRETLSRLMIMLGYGLKVEDCKTVLIGTSTDCSPNLTDELKHIGLSVSKADRIAVASQELACLVKSLLSGTVAKRAPLWGVLIGGAINYFSYKRIALRTKQILREVMYLRLEREALMFE